MSFRTADQMTTTRVRTGNDRLDDLLDGGLETGLMHLFFGHRVLHQDVLRLMVHAQLPPEQGGLNTSVIVIDSANMMDLDAVTQLSYRAGLEPEEVYDRIFISRAFNSSQTYDLVMNQLDGFFARVPARVLVLTGLVGLYHKEGLTAEGMQQITHMANRVMAFTLERDIVTIITTGTTEGRYPKPMGGRTLPSCCQVHVFVEDGKMHTRYSLTKHPYRSYRKVSVQKMAKVTTTLPLSCFVDEWGEE